MTVRHRDVLDVGRLHAELLELGRECLRSAPVDRARIGRALAIGHGGNRVGDPRVPQKPTLVVLDQIAAVSEAH